MTDSNEPQRPDNAQNPKSDDETGGIWGYVLCWLGFHDDKVIESTFGFGDGGNVEKVFCKRCGRTDIRSV